MLWELKVERNYIKFIVDYDKEVFDAIEPFFQIIEWDREIIMGNCDSYSIAPLPAIKDFLICLQRYLCGCQWSFEDNYARFARVSQF